MKTTELKLSSLLRQMREAEGISQAELATRCGFFNDKVVSNFENEARASTLKTLRKVADALGYQIEISVFKEKTETS